MRRIHAPFSVLLVCVAAAVGAPSCKLSPLPPVLCNTNADCPLSEWCIDGACRLETPSYLVDGGAPNRDAGATAQDAGGGGSRDAGSAGGDAGSPGDAGLHNDAGVRNDAGASSDDAGAPADAGDLCANGALDPGEDAVDCGGSCAPCVDNSCTGPADCPDAFCLSGQCRAPTSCADLLNHPTPLPTGPYAMVTGGGTVDAYCEMTRDGGGWLRIAHVDPAAGSCPGGWTLDPNTAGLCIHTDDAQWATAAFAPAVPGTYTEVMGVVVGRQFGNTDAFDMEGDPANPVLDGVYVDGVSITTLGEPRRHIWTYASGVRNNVSEYSCPCMGGIAAPDFVGDDFTCESGVLDGQQLLQQYYPDDPLWDGAGNADTALCPYGEAPAWFQTTLGAALPGAIEVRLMSNEPSSNEHAGVTFLELYVR